MVVTVPQEKDGLIRELEELIGQMEGLVTDKSAAEDAAAAARDEAAALIERLEAERAEAGQLHHEVWFVNTLTPRFDNNIPHA